ncbi:MAG: VTT domain-containing protein [Acidobacteriaceae bacterium]|nr:VTT domain-containing protein [Acidobacteriaceae bacterium]
MLTPEPALAFSLWGWLLRLRSIGEIAVGLADNSIIPMPGSLDVLTIWLAASERRYWLFYALMATVGALIGGYITYELARKGGKEALERKLRKRQAQKLTSRFERWGFGAVAVPAILPPPFPIVPFLLAAGALQYPRKKFLAALALGRGVRFTVIAGLGAIYGDAIVGFFSKYYKPALAILIGLAIIAGVFGVIEYLRHRKDPRGAGAQNAAPKAA